MSYDLGAHATYLGQKCLSITTGAQGDGTYEFLVHGLAGPDVPRHVHGWARVTTEGVVVGAGARLKDSVDEHLGSGLRLTGAGQEIARVTLTPTPDGITTRFSQQHGNSWLRTRESTFGGEVKRTEVQLPGARPNGSVEYSISMFDARTGVPSNTSTQVVIPFSSPLPFGLLFGQVNDG